MDTLEKNTLIRIYGITISPPFRNYSPEFLYNKDTPIIIRWLKRFSKHYIMFSEFDDSSRLHYHGTIYIDDITKFHKTRYNFSERVGYVKLDLLKKNKNLLTWTMYIRKQQYYMSKDFPFYYHKKNIKIKKLKQKEVVKKNIYYYFACQNSPKVLT